jgi:hypothetical protein
MHTRFESEDLKEGGHLEDLGVDGNIISKWILKKTRSECVGSINLGKEMVQSWVFVNTIKNALIP